MFRSGFFIAHKFSEVDRIKRGRYLQRNVVHQFMLLNALSIGVTSPITKQIPGADATCLNL